jgi:hypothetical protein
MKLLLIGSARARKYAIFHNLPHAIIVSKPADVLPLYPHPRDILIYFADESWYTTNALYERGFSLHRCPNPIPVVRKPLTESCL